MKFSPLGLFAASVTVLTALTVVTPLRGSSSASDNASNYTSATWTTGSNAGTGFGAWNFVTSNGSSGFNGSYIGGTALGSNTFGIYAGNANTGAFFDAQRPFTGGALAAGQTFSIDLGHTTIESGNLGLNFQSGTGSGATTVFSLIANGTNWQLNDGGGGGNFSVATDATNTSYHFTFTYNGGSSYSFALTSSAGSGSGTNYTAINNISGITQVQLFDFQQGGGENFGFNNLGITGTAVPEPSTYLGGAAVVVCGLLALCRRHRRTCLQGV